MAQHDYVIANGTGAAVRSDLNGSLAAIVSNNSGATQPTTTYAYQWWPDTTTGLLKLRNSANSAWVTVGTLASTNLGLIPAGSASIVNADVNASAGIVATKLSFTQAGTGATARTVDSRLKEVVSVKDFGAVGDGVADDTAAIQAAITASASKTLFFPPGQYKITSTLNLLSNTQYLGSQNSSLNFTVSEFGLRLPAPASNIEIKGFTIQGTFARGIGNDIGNTALNIKILENTISGATLVGAGYTAGIFLTNASDCIVKENKLSGNGFGPTTAYCADIGFYAPSAGSQNSRNLITGNKCFSTAVSFNIVCYNVDRTIISHNICKGAVTGSSNNNGYGIAIYDVTTYTLPYSTTSLNEVTNNAVTNTGGSGIYVASADNCVVSNNTLSNNAASQTDAILPVGAISINGGYSSAMSVTGNTIVSSTKDGIVLANTNYSTVNNNSIQTIGQHGIHLRGSGVGLIVSSNVVVAATARGIYDDTNSKTRINIANNNIYGCTAAGIELNGTTKSVIANNVSTSNGTYGILNNSNYNSLIGNVLLDNTTDAMISTGSGTIKRDNKFSSGESQGTVTLSGGSFTVTTAEIRTSDIVQITRTGIGGTLGHLAVRAIVNQASFLIDSSAGADTSVISWQIIH